MWWIFFLVQLYWCYSINAKGSIDFYPSAHLKTACPLVPEIWNGQENPRWLPGGHLGSEIWKESALAHVHVTMYHATKFDSCRCTHSWDMERTIYTTARPGGRAVVLSISQEWVHLKLSHLVAWYMVTYTCARSDSFQISDPRWPPGSHLGFSCPLLISGTSGHAAFKLGRMIHGNTCRSTCIVLCIIKCHILQLHWLKFLFCATFLSGYWTWSTLYLEHVMESCNFSDALLQREFLFCNFYKLVFRFFRLLLLCVHVCSAKNDSA